MFDKLYTEKSNSKFDNIDKIDLEPNSIKQNASSNLNLFQPSDMNEKDFKIEKLTNEPILQTSIFQCNPQVMAIVKTRIIMTYI